MLTSRHLTFVIALATAVSSVDSAFLLTTLFIWLADACLCQRCLSSDARTRCTNIHRVSCSSTLPPGEDPMAIASAHSVHWFLIRSNLDGGTEHPSVSSFQMASAKCRRDHLNPQWGGQSRQVLSMFVQFRSLFRASIAGSCCIMAGGRRLVDPWKWLLIPLARVVLDPFVFVGPSTIRLVSLLDARRCAVDGYTRLL